MGCGESKHAVSTENTLTPSKSRSKSFKNSSEKATTSDANVNPTPAQEPSNEVKGSGDGHDDELVENKIFEAIKDERLEVGKENPGEKVKGGDENAKANGTPIAAAKVEENKEEEKGREAVWETKGDEEMKGSEIEKVEAKEKVDIADQEVVKVASHGSPNHFSSPKRGHEETIDSIIPDGISGKSDYHSPPAKGKTEEKVEDGEAKPDAEKAEEITKVYEAKKVEAVDETEVLANHGDEKTAVAGDENAEATPSNDVKAN